MCKLMLEQRLVRGLLPGHVPHCMCGNRWCVNPLHLCEVNRHTSVADRPTLPIESTSELKKDAVYQVRYLADRGRDQAFIVEALGLPQWIVDTILNDSIWDRLHFSSAEKAAALVQLDPLGQPSMCFPIPHVDNHGYAYCHVNGRRYKASRFAYSLGRGKEPDPSSVIHHKCNNPDCVRPSHLEEYDQKSNIRYRRNAQLDANIEIFGEIIVDEMDSGRVTTFSGLAKKFDMDDKKVKRIYHHIKIHWPKRNR